MSIKGVACGAQPQRSEAIQQGLCSTLPVTKPSLSCPAYQTDPLHRSQQLSADRRQNCVSPNLQGDFWVIKAQLRRLTIGGMSSPNPRDSLLQKKQRGLSLPHPLVSFIANSLPSQCAELPARPLGPPLPLCIMKTCLSTASLEAKMA